MGSDMGTPCRAPVREMVYIRQKYSLLYGRRHGTDKPFVLPEMCYPLLYLTCHESKRTPSDITM